MSSTIVVFSVAVSVLMTVVLTIFMLVPRHTYVGNIELEHPHHRYARLLFGVLLGLGIAGAAAIGGSFYIFQAFQKVAWGSLIR
jgi:hypothetical protein